MVKLTPQLFVELTLDMVPKVISKISGAIEKNKEKLEKATDPQDTIQIVFEITLELRRDIGAELLPEGIDGVDMEAYMNDHEAEILAYLESKPRIKSKWDQLGEEFKQKFQQVTS